MNLIFNWKEKSLNALIEVVTLNTAHERSTFFSYNPNHGKVQFSRETISDGFFFVVYNYIIVVGLQKKMKSLAVSVIDKIEMFLMHVVVF